ncbi:hypothetical protein mvi_933 [Megavirus vitis]|uniref:Uncharacterized protein n=1 Tax=Megavirus courdo7 TaxID=1128135 RepID=H2ECE0_9VIRU|nr:hypothetical protein c7_R1216 [Megavirus courdo7]AVL94293.1 hypothetical protein mvi_933 [Megavirus vitis]
MYTNTRFILTIIIMFVVGVNAIHEEAQTYTIGYKKLVCNSRGTQQFEVVATILIPDNVVMTRVQDSKYYSHVEADIAYVGNIKVAQKHIDSFFTAYNIPHELLNEYVCTTGSKIIAPNQLVHNIDFYLNMDDVLDINLLEDNNQLSIETLERREIALAFSLLDIHEMINENDYDSEHENALKYLAAECKGNLFGVTRLLNKLEIERDGLVISLVNSAFKSKIKSKNIDF